jgi:hypothetical protein
MPGIRFCRVPGIFRLRKGLLFGDDFVEVEEEVGEGGEGGELDGVKVLRDGGGADGGEGRGGLGISLKMGQVFVESGGEDLQFLWLRGALGDELEGVSDCVVGVFAKDAFGEFAGGFDEGGFVEEGEGLEGGVGAFGADPAGFAVGCVKDGHGGRVDGALPDGVEAAAEEIFAFGLSVFLSHRHFDPEVLRLVGADGWAAEFFDEESADGEGLIANNVGGKALPRTAGEETVVGICF